jgi:predicted RNA-binding Zn-ribbon protein involved in translation (DUF1610 family)
MDIIFNCPHCEQELAVDSAGAGTEIECPSCGETIAIPQESTKSASAPATGLAPSAISISAAAKVEKHLKVPLRDQPGEILIAKRAVPLGKTPGGAKQICVRTIRHASCVEAGHDKFDSKVAEFLNEAGEANITGIHTISYTFFDVGTQKILNDYGVLVIYKG